VICGARVRIGWLAVGYLAACSISLQQSGQRSRAACAAWIYVPRFQSYIRALLRQRAAAFAAAYDVCSGG
jgi:hypothetical protein